MINLNEYTIRHYLPADREALRRIAYETSVLGEPEIFKLDPELISDALTIFFTDFEPESSFVVVKLGIIVGYLIGTTNIQRMHQVFNKRILWPTVLKALKKGMLFNGHFLSFVLNSFLSLLKGEFRTPNYQKQYQALFHINLNQDCRGSGIGSLLIKNFEDYLINHHIKTVCIGTMTDRGKNFFIKNGYQVFFESRRSYLKYKLHKTVPYYLLGKTLTDASSKI